MKQLDKIAQFGKELIKMDDTDEAIELIAKEVKELVNAQRCSIFIVDKEDGILWTTLSDGLGRIVIAVDQGIVGATYQSREPQLVNEPYKDERFLTNIDKKSGYITKNMITIPIFNSKRDVMGIMQLLNKETDFDVKDLEILTFFANYISGTLELSLLNSQI